MSFTRRNGSPGTPSSRSRSSVPNSRSGAHTFAGFPPGNLLRLVGGLRWDSRSPRWAEAGGRCVCGGRVVRYLQPPPRPPRRAASSAGRWWSRNPTRIALGGAGAVAQVAQLTVPGSRGRGSRTSPPVLAGRGPSPDRRLITAQGSAGRRPTLGSGAHQRSADEGTALRRGRRCCGLGLSRTGRSRRMLGVGTAVALGTFAQAVGGPQATPGRRGRTSRATSRRVSRIAVDLPFHLPARPPVWSPVGAVTRRFWQPGGSYLVPLVEGDGVRGGCGPSSWPVRPCPRRGIDPGTSIAGSADDQSLAEAARLVSLTKQYLRGLARYRRNYRVEIERSPRGRAAPAPGVPGRPPWHQRPVVGHP